MCDDFDYGQCDDYEYEYYFDDEVMEIAATPITISPDEDSANSDSVPAPLS